MTRGLAHAHARTVVCRLCSPRCRGSQAFKRVYAQLVGAVLCEYASPEDAANLATRPRVQCDLIGVSASAQARSRSIGRNAEHRFIYVTRNGTTCQVAPAAKPWIQNRAASRP